MTFQKIQTFAFPSLTICDRNGFKNQSVMQSANMSNYHLLREFEFEFWPNKANQVEASWKKITFEFDELVEKIGIRYNSGTYCYLFSSSEIPCQDSISNVVTLATLQHGRCYVIEFPQSTNFWGKNKIR